MKKLLLLTAASLLTASSAFAFGADPATYETTNGIKCSNIWLNSRGLDKATYEASIPGKTPAKYRTAAVYNEVIYIGSSLADDPTVVDEKGNKVDVAGVDMYSLKTGEYLGKIKVTLDGKRISGLLCANQVGIDSFGNLWIAPYVSSNTYGGYKIYSVNKTTGEAALQGELPMTENGRIDYCDVIGDITRTQANCTVMAAAAPPASNAVVYRWVAAKGGNWEGGFDGDDSFVYTDLYPSGQTAWSYAPTTKIVLGEGEAAYSGELFYIDGFTTAPTLYNTNGIVDSFGSAPELVQESLGANGVTEFTINGKNFIAYVNNQHTGDRGGNEIRICELGEGMTFAGMTSYWFIPAAGLNPEKTSDGGTRVHSISTEYVKDSKGKEGVLLLTYKCNAGFGVYLIADKDFELAGVEDAIAGNTATITVNGGVISTSEEASEIAVYNVAGQLVAKANNATSVDAPAAAGTYIIKATVAGAPVVKKVVL